jgi:hypothetical protein
MQECVTLSVKVAELIATTNCIQDIRNILESMGLKIKLSMEVELDNKGAKDIIKNWSVGGTIRHVGIRFNFPRELKENGIIEIQWINAHENCYDIPTVNIPVNLHNKLPNIFVLMNMIQRLLCSRVSSLSKIRVNSSNQE